MNDYEQMTDDLIQNFYNENYKIIADLTENAGIHDVSKHVTEVLVFACSTYAKCLFSLITLADDEEFKKRMAKLAGNALSEQILLEFQDQTETEILEKLITEVLKKNDKED